MVRINTRAPSEWLFFLADTTPVAYIARLVRKEFK
jgi:hypothetical protein